jgi:hypothetical protein
MIFEPLNFEELNETDIREEILAPLIKYLGYRTGTENNVIREQSLRYPRLFLGRKDHKKDPILRGKADYILEADRAARWVVEAKAPNVELDIDAIEQAWTYANHAEVRAVYFALSNGRMLHLFQTNQGPNQSPILEISYDELNEQLDKISNLLSPEAILRDHPKTEVDTGNPLGPGLRSVARITNGLIQYDKSNINIRVLTELQTGIAFGAVERDESDKLIAYLKTIGPSKSLQELNERLGLSSFEMQSNDKTLSITSDKPTQFIYNQKIVLPAGEKLLDLNTWREVVLPQNISCDVKAIAEGILDGHKFFGRFYTNMQYDVGISAELGGKFEVYLA